MTPADSSETVEREVYIAARPETVFAFFTDPARMVQWSGGLATLDPRPGGLYRVVVTDGWVERGEYVEVTPYHRLVYTFGWEGEGKPLAPGTTTVEVTLTLDGDGTRLRLRHSGLPAEHRASHAAGWDHYLPRLAAAAEGRDPGPDSWAAAPASTTG